MVFFILVDVLSCFVIKVFCFDCDVILILYVIIFYLNVIIRIGIVIMWLKSWSLLIICLVWVILFLMIFVVFLVGRVKVVVLICWFWKRYCIFKRLYGVWFIFFVCNWNVKFLFFVRIFKWWFWLRLIFKV